jgi:hypothetical protein
MAEESLDVLLTILVAAPAAIGAHRQSSKPIALKADDPWLRMDLIRGGPISLHQ